VHALVAVVVVAAALAAVSPASGAVRPVPSLTPAATQKLWTQLVHRRHTTGPLAAKDCKPLRAVFYTESDWLRLATKLAASASPCAQYWISIPPLAADKTKFRYDQPWRIRALGPNFHVLAEINYTGWSKWVAANGSTWFDAGVEARRRMAASGFDVASGDTWALNELSSAVRRGVGVARQNARDFLRGLYTGDGSAPPVKGVVWNIGISQTNGDLVTYKVNLQDWYGDTAFWQDMSAYVSDWSQELYGDVGAYAVAGSSLAQRVDHLDDFLGHQLALAAAAPAADGAAQTFLAAATTPLANAAWIWTDGFGNTNVPVATMQDYVSAQIDALRTLDARLGLPQDRFGFAWAPRNVNNAAWTAQYTAQSGQLLDRLAAAIRDSAANPALACTGTCTTTLAGAAFTEGWKTFAAWSPPELALVGGAPGTLTAGTVSAPISVGLETDGVSDPQGTDLTVTLTSSSATGAFSMSAVGPWTPSLTLTIPAGTTTSPSFYYTDTSVGSAILTATDASGTRAPAGAAVTVAAPTVRVTSLAYSLQGRHLVVTAQALDATSSPVAGAALSLVVRRGSSRFATLAGTTGTDGNVILRSAKNVARGCYSSTVQSVAANGLTWDGQTPVNQFCR
jgi:hypothetical protein